MRRRGRKKNKQIEVKGKIKTIRKKKSKRFGLKAVRKNGKNIRGWFKEVEGGKEKEKERQEDETDDEEEEMEETHRSSRRGRKEEGKKKERMICRKQVWPSMRYLYLYWLKTQLIWDGRMNGRTDWQTSSRTNGRTKKTNRLSDGDINRRRDG